MQRTAIFVAKTVNHTLKVQRTDTLSKLYFGALHLRNIDYLVTTAKGIPLGKYFAATEVIGTSLPLA